MSTDHGRAADHGLDPAGQRTGERRLLVAAVTGALIGSLPVWLTGALAVQIDRDLGIGPARLGVASGVFFGAAAVGSALAGRVAERTGPVRAMRISAAVAAAVLAGLGAAPSYAWLLGALVVAGLGNSLAQVGANLLIARGVPPEHQGWALAVKQAGVPAGTLLGGLAVPIFGVTVGWRWAYLVATIGALATWLAVPSAQVGTRLRTTEKSSLDSAMGPLLLLAVAVAFATAANGSLATFIVSAGVGSGLGEGAAGLVLTAGSAMGITVRLLAGRQADRRGGRHLPVVSAMLVGGSIGYLFLVPGAVETHLIGAMVAFGSGWAWPGLFNLAVVRLNPSAPAAATGITQTGVYVGALSGPVIFGLVVDASGYRAAWTMAAVSALIAAVGIAYARSKLLKRADPVPSASA